MTRPNLVVFCGGANLILIQWVLVRELTALLRGTELVILWVSIAYFAGLSLGYWSARWMRQQWLPMLAIMTLITHLTLLIWFRLLVAGLDASGAYWAAFIIVPLLTPLIVSSFYSIFLPFYADSGAGDLPTLYTLELAGSILGIGVLVILGGVGLEAVYLIYSLNLLVILGLLKLHPLWIGTLGTGLIIWLLVLPGANRWSNALWYQQIHHLPSGTITLFAGYSPYQKVDVLENPQGDRYLYLDGLNHFGAAGSEQLNILMGRIPAQLMKPQDVLVIGAGSMQMAQMIAQEAGHVTTVELDPLVVEVSKRYFLKYNQMDTLTNRSIIIDDAKHFIANTDQKYDLIATDIPAAFSIQTATLYSESFYQRLADHLKPGGVLVVNLTSTFRPEDQVSRRICAGLLATFQEVMVVNSLGAGWSFAYVSDDLPFTSAMLNEALHANNEYQFVIFETSAVRIVVGDAKPITLDSMDIVLIESADWIEDRVR